MRAKRAAKSPTSVELLMRSQQAAELERVISCTDELVALALRADWAEVLDGIDARRRMLQNILARQSGESAEMAPQLSALTAAVSESERALMRVVAHAIASSRSPGARFAMYH